MFRESLVCYLGGDKVIFSIIIPCYKVEEYIGECLDSVLAQDFADWEAICVDDGSPDRTGVILDEYASRDSRINVIHQKNGGLSAARNAALKVAQGEWLYYLDSDDLMPPDMLVKVNHDVATHPCADMVWGKLSKFMDGLEPEWNSGSRPAVEIDVSDTFFFRHFSTYFPTFLFKRSVFGDIPFVGESWCEERPYMAKCLARAKTMVEIDYSTYGFRERAGSITHTRMQLKHCTGYLDATREMLKILTASGKHIEPALMRILLTDWMEWTPRNIVIRLDAKNRSAAWRYWFNSLKEIQQYGHAMTAWRRFTAIVCRVLPLRFVAMVLCYLPDYIKRKGLHR
ncbi:MAG: glycosyltransferase family 2 protein [Kiritimatiellae bacterium]|nr:glycosyltransferase family 2 protein [Kiritimatiellia bacterium]